MFDSLKRLFSKSLITAIDKNTIASSDGWRLQFVGSSPSTWRLLYWEGERNLQIATETGIGGSRCYFDYVYLSNVHGWQTPHEQEPFDRNDKKRIAKNIRSGMRYLKRNCKIVY